ncbi:hypothetical protein P5673_021882 [Acropora cervicornis]|uniref:Uncharacterized protein n=1 Tax=Acropora cervicornis TaxID=6130 RepID=A0AAD9Q7S0_ACRCE|nr:hypothetical protein P5673_021882 [Acropora cervicornis]
MAAAHTHPIKKSWYKFKIEHFFSEAKLICICMIVPKKLWNARCRAASGLLSAKILLPI